MSAPGSRLAFPGSGFRIWLAVLACVSALAGFAFSVDAWSFIWLLTFPLFLFLLLSLVPVGITIWVSFHHLRQARFGTAACYASLPFIAIVIAIAFAWIGFKGETGSRLLRYDREIAAAKKTGAIVNTDETWIDPGPPTRARFSRGGSVLAAAYVVYAEKGDEVWLQGQVDKCNARPIMLGRNYYAIAGSC